MSNTTWGFIGVVSAAFLGFIVGSIIVYFGLWLFILVGETSMRYLG
jgi:hypothetical protein